MFKPPSTPNHLVQRSCLQDRFKCDECVRSSLFTLEMCWNKSNCSNCMKQSQYNTICSNTTCFQMQSSNPPLIHIPLACSQLEENPRNPEHPGLSYSMTLRMRHITQCLALGHSWMFLVKVLIYKYIYTSLYIYIYLSLSWLMLFGAFYLSILPTSTHLQSHRHSSSPKAQRDPKGFHLEDRLDHTLHIPPILELVKAALRLLWCGCSLVARHCESLCSVLPCLWLYHYMSICLYV